MTATVSRLAPALQALLTTEADAAARDCGLVRRRRRLTGAALIRALVLGWLARPEAVIDELAEPLGVTRQALDHRLGPALAAALARLLAAAVRAAWAAPAATIPALRRFTAVVIDDTTARALPAELAGSLPGCGGGRGGQAGLKLFARWDVLGGRLIRLEGRPGRDSDRAAAVDAGWDGLPAGALWLRDLGFFALGVLAEASRRGVHWISRTPTHLAVRGADGAATTLADWLAGATGDRLDAAVELGTKCRLPCRLVAARAPREVAEARLRRLRAALRRKGRTLSAAQRQTCRWTTFATDLPAAYDFEAVWALYRVRWQVELLFKRWKGLGALAHSAGRRGDRVLCETYAKLLGLVVEQWATLLRGGPLGAASPTAAARRVRSCAGGLAAAVGRGAAAVAGVLEGLRLALGRLPRRARRDPPSTRQRLFGLRLRA
jgi:hypothetical protein